MKALKMYDVARKLLTYDVEMDKAKNIIRDLATPTKLILPYKTTVKGEERFVFQYAWYNNGEDSFEEVLNEAGDNLDIIRLRYLYYTVLNNEKVGQAVFDIRYLLKTFGVLNEAGFKHIIYVKDLYRGYLSCTGEFEELWKNVEKQYGPAWVYEKPDVQVISSSIARECIEDILRGIGSEKVMVVTEDINYLKGGMAIVGIEDEKPVYLFGYLRSLGIPILEIGGFELPHGFENKELIVWNEYCKPED